MIINLKEKNIIEKYLKEASYKIDVISDKKFDFQFENLDKTIDLLTDIFTNYGLQENDEPNEDGLILDNLIGKLWQLKLNNNKEKLDAWIKNQNVNYPSSGHLDDIFEVSTIDLDIIESSLNLLSECNTKSEPDKILTLCIYLKERKNSLANITQLKMNMLSEEPPEFVFQKNKDIPTKEIFIKNFPVNLKYYLGEVFDNDDKLYYPYIVVKR